MYNKSMVNEKYTELKVKHLIQQRADYAKIVIALGIGTFGLPFMHMQKVLTVTFMSLGLIFLYLFIMNIGTVDNEIDKKLGGLL
jgi:hypothetical protein